MVGQKTNFKRGGKKTNKISRRKTEVAAKASDMKGFDAEKAALSAKDIDEQPMPVERIKHLQRQAKNAGIDVKEAKLRKEQEARLKYNMSLRDIDGNSPFTNTLIPRNKAIVRLFKKPIFELNGFLKPDLLKQNTEGGGVTYTENRFPYLEGGVIVTQNGMEEMFGEDNTYEGAAISLTLNCQLHKYIYFIDKTDIKPDTFEGYILIPLHEIESIISLPKNPKYMDMVQELTGITANQALQTEVALEKEAIEAKKAEIAKQAKLDELTAEVAPDLKEEVQATIKPLMPEGTVWTDGSHS